ncbi:MAG: hypothetical protein WCT12_29870 [Verrucomicrobiota bacterium]
MKVTDKGQVITVRCYCAVAARLGPATLACPISQARRRSHRFTLQAAPVK